MDRRTPEELHGHRHGHGGHRHVHGRGDGLLLALILTLVILVVEVVGGAVSQSLSLLADAGHVVTDVGALAMALFAARQARRPADQRRTFGYHRTGILIALLNAGSLIAIALIIVVEAYGRLIHPQGVHPLPMILAAGVGLVLNLAIAARLHGHGDDLNIRGAWLHVLSDAGAAAGVIVAAIAIAATGVLLLDPLLSIGIAVLVAVGAIRLLNEALEVLLEATPRGLDMGRMVEQMLKTPGVLDIHDLHVWSIGSGLPMLSCHVRIDEQPLSSGLEVVACMNAMLSERFGIAHCTIQPEMESCAFSTLYCTVGHGAGENESRISSATA